MASRRAVAHAGPTNPSVATAVDAATRSGVKLRRMIRQRVARDVGHRQLDLPVRIHQWEDCPVAPAVERSVKLVVGENTQNLIRVVRKRIDRKRAFVILGMGGQGP